MSTFNVSPENSAVPSKLPPGNNESGVINPGFQEKEEEQSDLGENFLNDFQLENSLTEKSCDTKSSDLGNFITSGDKPREKESEVNSVTPTGGQTGTPPSDIESAKSQHVNSPTEDEEQRKKDRKGLTDKTQSVPPPQTVPIKIVKKKQSLTRQIDDHDLITSKDYVWGPLFQELPYKAVTFNPPHAVRPASYVQEAVRYRKPFRQNDQTRPIKRYDSEASQDDKDQTRWHHVTRDIIQAVFVRLLLICHSFLCVWRAVDVKKDPLYWLMALTNVLMVIETIYTVVKRQGRDPKWICPCFVIYLGGTVPALWFLQIDKLDRYNDAVSANVSNLTDTLQEALSSIEGIQIPIYLDPDTWVAILEQILLFVLVVGRMLLPLGSLSREELSQLLFIFIGSGSDVMELFVVFDEPQFRTNSPLKFATLTVWSVSLLQFTFVFTAAKNPKKMRLGTTEHKYHDVKEKRAVFGIEILSLMISFLLMDGPYCALRLYAIIVYRVVSYGIIFFTCKNILMLVLLCYRLFIICIKYRNRGKDKKEALREIAHHKHRQHHKV